MNEDRDAVALSANNPRSKRRFLVVAHGDVVAGLRIERGIVRAGAVRH